MRKMFNLKRILIMTILCGFLSVVGLSFDVYAGEFNEPPAQEEQPAQTSSESGYNFQCVKMLLLAHSFTQEEVTDTFVENVISNLGQVDFNSDVDDVILKKARELTGKEQEVDVPPYDTNGNHIEKEVVKAANGEEWQDCKERVANGEDIECKQGEMTEDVPNEGHGYSDLYNGGNYSKIRTDRFGSCFLDLITTISLKERFPVG